MPADLDARFARPRRPFFGVGAQMLASSWLDRPLRKHPEVCLPLRKERRCWTTGERAGDFLGVARRLAPATRKVGESAFGKVEFPPAAEALAPIRDYVRARSGEAVPGKWHRPAVPVGEAV